MDLVVIHFITIGEAIGFQNAIVLGLGLVFVLGSLLSQRPFLSLDTEAVVLHNIVMWVVLSLYFVIVGLVTVGETVGL